MFALRCLCRRQCPDCIPRSTLPIPYVFPVPLCRTNPSPFSAPFFRVLPRCLCMMPLSHCPRLLWALALSQSVNTSLDIR